MRFRKGAASAAPIRVITNGFSPSGSLFAWVGLQENLSSSQGWLSGSHLSGVPTALFLRVVSFPPVNWRATLVSSLRNAMISPVLPTNYQLPSTNYHLPSTTYQLPTTNYQPN